MEKSHQHFNEFNGLFQTLYINLLVASLNPTKCCINEMSEARKMFITIWMCKHRNRGFFHMIWVQATIPDNLQYL